MTRYNVLTEPWITAVDSDGREREYGLLDTLLRAHELLGVVDASPPIQFGLYRLLVTFVQHAMQLSEYEDLQDVWDKGRFDADEFEAYTKRVGWHRFDLFDAERPFLQSPPMDGDDNKTASVVQLFYHIPAGGNLAHFVHVEEGRQAVSPAVAARGLCSIAPFMVQGGRGYAPSVNGTPPWYALALGRNLFETILLNCCVMRIGGLAHSAPPAWASDAPFEPHQRKAARSLAEGFTWQPRQVRLLPGDGGLCTYSGRRSAVLIKRIVWGPGLMFSGQDTWLDPNVAYQEDEKRGRLTVRPRERRQLWRDYAALFLARERQDGKSQKLLRPVIVTQLAHLKEQGYVPSDTAEHFEVYGVRADQAKLLEWQYERMPLKTAVLQNPLADVQVRRALELAEKVAGAIHAALKRLHPREGKGNPKALGGLIQVAESRYWTELQQVFEAEYLPTLETQSPEDEVARSNLLASWKKALRAVGWQCVSEAVGGIETGAEALRRQVEARNVFGGMLAAILDDKPASKQRKRRR